MCIIQSSQNSEHKLSWVLYCCTNVIQGDSDERDDGVMLLDRFEDTVDILFAIYQSDVGK
jgi:hypothetical protein